MPELFAVTNLIKENEANLPEKVLETLLELHDRSNFALKLNLRYLNIVKLPVSDLF